MAAPRAVEHAFPARRKALRLLGSWVVFLLLCTAARTAEEQIPLSLPAETMPDEADLVTWPLPGYPVFAPGSAGHLSWLMDAPAGKHGAVRTQPDGSLVFEDGTPARFWGTTTVYGMTFPDKVEEIPLLADAIAARGYNMVRFHHNDLTWGGIGFLQGKPESNHLLDPVWMDRLDRFAAELIQRGVYIYLDLVDSRRPLAEDGMFEEFPDLKGKDQMGWKGLFPHPKIVQAWKRSVTELLQHKNPYTGRTWGEDPAVVTIEIINENGLFWDWSFKVSDSVHKWYDRTWNEWLVAKYGTREKLDAAWTNVDGVRGLFPDEDPAKGNVFRPRLMPLLEWDRPYRSKTRGTARINDYYASLAEQMRSFYQDASRHLRDSGFKGVIVGSHELQGPLNRHAESITGTVGAHLYARPLPAWYARPTSGGSVIEGVDVKTTNWFSNIPRIKVRGCSSVNGEWAAGSVIHRADANVAVAASTAFQGVDQSLHFSYGHRWHKVKMSNYDTLFDWREYAKSVGMTFSSHHDIPWMIANRICAALFIRGDLKKPKQTVHIAYSNADLHEQNLHALGLSGGNGTIGDAALFLPLLHNVECAFFDTAYEGDADVVFMTGRSASGDYSKARHAVLVGDNPFCDPYHKERDIGRPATLARPGVKVETVKTPVEFTVSWPYAEPRTLSYGSYEGAVLASTVPAGAQTIGASADGKYVLGWLDDKYLVLPNGRAYQSRIGDRRWLYRLYLEACRRWQIDVGDNSADAPFYRSDTGELTVDWGHGTLVIDTPRTQGVSGLVGWREENRTGDLECSMQTPYGNVLATSVDGKPLRSSNRMLLVAVGRMRNTDQQIRTRPNGKAEMLKAGRGPCLVEALRGTVTLRHENPAGLKVYALDHEGKRLGVVETKTGEKTLSLELSPKWKSVWFEIAAEEVDAPALAEADWPAQNVAPMPAYPQPERIPLAKFFESANRSKSASDTAEVEAGDEMRVMLADFTAKIPGAKYGNIKLTQVADLDRGKVLQAQFGKINQEWCGGWWTTLEAPGGLKAESVLGLGIAFQGDGTLPRDTFIHVETAGGVRYKTGKNHNFLFETDAWNDVVLPPDAFRIDPDFAKKHPDKAKDAPAHPNLGTTKRIDFVCVGPLMDQKSVGRFGSIFLLVKRGQQADGDAFKVALPEPKVPASGTIRIPFVEDAALVLDGSVDEAAWTQALPLPLDEDAVPDWHFFGSFVVGGNRLDDESANFWLLATPQGLGLIADVDKGGRAIVAERKDWYENDCLEVFSDPKNEGKKPFVQLFMAYRRPSLDLAAASDAQVKIGRCATAKGYVLEALIPWGVLGFEGVPEGEFGLELQMDFASPGAGRTLQMVYGTGTNEAWISAKHYLKARVAK